MEADLRNRLLLSIGSDRLAIICGAGLSMSPPTNLPSARPLAEICADCYTRRTGSPIHEEIRGNLERLADFFLEMNRFPEFLEFVPWELFFRNPNGGHAAIADFLCCGALSLAATTNYDTHIEDASFELGERDFQAALDGIEANELPEKHRPLLKLHGCCKLDRPNTIWARSQLQNNQRIQSCVASSTRWLGGHLGGKDLLFVGFWTDWDYLNDVLSTALASSNPRTVVLVDPDAQDSLRDKAPDLWDWANREGVEFFHVPANADAFLDELRAIFSRQFLEEALRGGVQVFNALFPGIEPVGLRLFDTLSTDDLYSLRKDFSGSSSVRPARSRKPDETMDLVGALVLAILSAGGTLEGALLSLSGKRIRVVNCSSRLLSRVRAEFTDDLGVSRNCDTVVCAGALDDGTPGDLVRGGEGRTIVRPGWDGEWLTHDSAKDRLGL